MPSFKGDTVNCSWCDTEFVRERASTGKRDFCPRCRDIGVPKAMTRFESRLAKRIAETGTAHIKPQAIENLKKFDDTVNKRGADSGLKPAQMRAELREILKKAGEEARRRVNDPEYMEGLGMYELTRLMDTLAKYGVGQKTEITGADDGPLQWGVFVLPPLQKPAIALPPGNGTTAEDEIPEAKVEFE